MTFIPLQLPPGVVRGANPDDTPGRWYDASLIRWRDGIMEPVGGWSLVTSTALSSTPRKIHQWRKNNNLTGTLIGTDATLMADESSTFSDVAPVDLVPLETASSASTSGYGAGLYSAGTYGTARTSTTNLTVSLPAWSFSNWGEDVLAVASTDGRLLYYRSSAPTANADPVGIYYITSIVRASNVVTVTTNSPHYLSSGNTVSILDVPITSFNTTSVSVTVTSATTFTYAQTAGDASWSVSNPLPNAGAVALVDEEVGFALDFTDNSYALGYRARVRDLSVPTGNRAVIVTPERHVMLLQAGGEPRRIAWSSREDYTDWNFASATNTAGFIDLQTETPLFAASAVREGTLVWSYNRAFLMRYLGQPFIYGADELGTTRLYAPNAFAEFDGRCVWMDSSGFMIYQGGAMQPLPCPLTDFVFSTIDPANGPRVSHAVVNGKFDEVWFFYPTIGNSECDRYIVWNWSENWWSMGKLSRSAAFPAGVNPNPTMTTPEGVIYKHEDGWTYDAFDCNNNVFISSGTLNLPDAETAMTVQQLLPSNGGDFALTKYTLYTRLTPNGPERQFGPYYSRSDGYVDTRAVGRDVRLRICANGAGDWSIGRIRLKVGSGGGTR